jgi:hypothetical protein
MAVISKIRDCDGQGGEKRGPWYADGEKVNWFSHNGKQYGGSSKNPDKN